MRDNDHPDVGDIVIRMQGEVEAFISEGGYVVITERKPVSGDVESVAVSPVFVDALISRLKSLKAQLSDMNGGE